MNSSSIWFDSARKIPHFPTLGKDLATDVAIVGGGITGLVAAYLLLKAGQKVAVFERNQVASGETAYSTAFLSAYMDLGFDRLLDTVGVEKAKLVWESGIGAINLIEHIILEEKIECEFQKLPLTLYATDQKQLDSLRQERQQASPVGATAELQQANSLPFSSFGALQIPHQATFNPLQFVRQLSLRVAKMGGQVFEKSSVEQISTDSPALLTVNGHTVTAKNVVAATHTPINSQKLMAIALRPDTTYVIAGTLPRNAVSVGLYLDSLKPYHYLRLTHLDNKIDSFVFGGEDHWTGSGKPNSDPFENLTKEFRQRFCAEATVTNNWGGQIFASLDGLPYIGRHPFHSNQFFGTGYAGDGLTFSVVAAETLTHLIVGTYAPYADVYTPRRWRGWPSLLDHGQQVVSALIHHQQQKASQASTPAALAADEGAVMTVDGKNVAAYKDVAGKISLLSPVCTHLGCTVQWNAQLKSWDCPCHGSRFTPTGEVMSGPANRPLLAK